VLVVSDLHGNLAALQAVAAVPHDALVCLGDLVGYGPEPGAVVRWVREHAALVMQGNHDRALADGVAPGCRSGFQRLAAATFPIGAAQVDPEERAYLGSLPREARRTFDGVRCLFVHATPADPLYRYLGPDPAGWERELAGVEANLVLVGHTHLAFELSGGGRRVVNPGSVGQPKDGDPRAAFALLECGRVTLGRVAYPVERTVQGLERAGLSAGVFQPLAELLRSGRVPPGLDRTRRGR
jgi:predicted phosphodiesterase